jgi:hypothetical protein
MHYKTIHYTKCILLLVASLLAGLQIARGQCRSFIEPFDTPFVNCTPPSTGLTGSCFSRYSTQYPSAAASTWVSDPANLPVFNANNGAPAFSVGKNPLNGTNSLKVKPNSVGGITNFQAEGVKGILYQVVWSKRVSVPAGYGGRLSVEVPGSGGTTSQPYQDLRIGLSEVAPAYGGALYSYMTSTSSPLATFLRGSNASKPQYETVSGSSTRLVFTVPANSSGSDFYLTLYAPQELLYSTAAQNAPGREAAQALNYYTLDNITFRSDEPDYLEPFDTPFVNCTPPSTGLTGSCFSRYSTQYPSAAASTWVSDPANLPVFNANNGAPAFSVGKNPLNGTNSLKVKPNSVGGITNFQAEGVKGILYQVVWSKRVSVPAGYGGRLSVEVPGSGGTTSQPYQDLRIGLSEVAPAYGGALYSYMTSTSSPLATFLRGSNASKPQYETVSGSSTRLVFTVPANSSGSDFYLTLYAPQELLYSTAAQNAPGREAAQALNYYTLDNIAFRSDAALGQLDQPDVANVPLCTPGTVQLTVNSIQAGVTYNWYTPTATTTPFATGPSVSVTGPATYYVQAIPDSRLGCPSEFKTVAITQSLPVSNPTLTGGSICPGTTATIVLTASGQSGVDYYWYDSATPTGPSPYPIGNTLTVTTSTARTYYVQAIPQSGPATGCPSGFAQVDITVQSVTLPMASVPSSVVKGNSLDVALTGDPTYSYTWNWHDPDKPGLSTGMAATHTYDKLGTYDVELTYADTHAPPCVTTMHFTVVVGNKLCELTLDGTNLSGLRVLLSNRTGAYVLQTPVSATACLATSTIFDCLTGQGQGQEVVAASAVAYTGAAPASDAAYNLTAANLEANPFLSGGGRLRPEATYAYSTPVLTTPDYERSTERGRFLAVPFNWQLSGGNRLPAWLRAGQATRYSPDGEALEEQDVLHIYSTVKMGYQGHSLVYLSAKNAGYGQVLFESFEKTAADPLANPLEGEDQFTASSTEATRRDDYAHAGTHSLELTTSGSQAQLSLRAFQATWTGPVQVKFWLRASLSGSPAQALSQATLSAATLAVHWSGTSLADSPVQIVAQTGEWLLCEATASGLPATSFTPQIQLTNLGGWRVWLDDVRVQPLAAQMTCSVYDPLSLRLLASFDDQHFGLYYQYNVEGKLVRKQVETQRGLKTIQETQYHSIQP